MPAARSGKVRSIVLLIVLQAVVVTLVLQALRLLLPQAWATSPATQGFVGGFIGVGLIVAYNVLTGRVKLRRR